MVLTYGEMPNVMDHINRNKTDNRIANLRSCEHFENAANKGPLVHGKYRGVFKEGNRWRVIITKHKLQYCKGSYLTPEDAAKAYDHWARIMHGEFAFLNFPD